MPTAVEGMNAMYYLDADHLVAYNEIKHIQSSYLSCNGGECDDSLLVSGFSGGAVITLPVAATAFPKADWNIYIPQLEVSVKDAAKVLTDDSHDDKSPLYGLPVLPTGQADPLHADGIPLSELFSIKIKEDSYDIVDSYDDGYELFTHMSTRQNGAVITEHYLDVAGGSMTCSSNRDDPSDLGNYGEGKVYNLGNEKAILDQAQMYFDNCRLKVASSSILDQALISWNDAHDSRCCQADLDVEEIHIPAGKAKKACAAGAAGKQDVCVGRENNVRALSAPYAKLTVVDKRKIMIGTTELSLLRRQEIHSGHGVTVSGANVGFLISKQGNINANVDGSYAFDIYGTHSMVGYNTDATPCTGIAGSCQEVHGCDISNTNFALGGSSDAKCEEKMVTTSVHDNEYKLHTIRSSAQCNGRLDIQLRDRGTSSSSILMNGGNSLAGPFRLVYDVRLPCSRVTAQASDSIEMKFKFDLSYKLSDNEYVMTTTGIGGLTCSGASCSKTDYAAGSSGFSSAMEATAYFGTCKDTFDSSLDNVKPDTVSGCDNSVWTGSHADASASVFSATEEANDCYPLATAADATKIESSVNLALVYKRSFKYDISRSRAVGSTDLAGDTTYTEDQYYCQDQMFKVSVERNKQAAVLVSTPHQLVAERKAQIKSVDWKACTGENVFKLQVVVDIKQQDVSGVNDGGGNTGNEAFWEQMTIEDDDVTLIGNNELGSVITSSGTTIKLESSCIAVTAADCSGTYESAWSALKETKTEFLLSSDDGFLDSSTGIDIVSNIIVETNFESCPVDVDVEEVGELSVALSFNLADGDVCLDNGGSTATDESDNAITNCAAAMATDKGEVRLHAYIRDSSGGFTYTDGAIESNGEYKIQSEKYYLKRFEQGFGGELGPQIGDTKQICDGNTVVPGSATLFQSGLSGHKCSFELIQFAQADALNDVFEVSVDVDLMNSARRRLLRKTIRLKAGDLHSSVGFKVISETTTVMDEEAASSLPAAQNATEVDEEEEDDHTHKDLEDSHNMLVVWVIVAVAVAAVVLFVLCRNAKAQKGDDVVDLVLQAGKYKKVNMEEKFENLRY